MRIVWFAVCIALTAWNAYSEPVGRRRAILIGINDYTASRLGAKPRPAAPGRDWPNLAGALNDIAAIQEMLVLLYGFRNRDIVTLSNQNATRVAILQSLERLAKSAAKGDVLLFYFAGHGSQVQNSLSNEPDKLDESIVPADSRVGAPDIRDKELRRLFNRILDRGARLTVILDNCYSGSGARGLATGARPRGLKHDSRDIADRTNGGPRPEDRGALVIAATQDSDRAWETRDDQGKMHGAFSWAMIRALRDSSAGEPASDTFLRAHARLRGEMPYQEPVLAGTAEARLNPFLGARIDRRNGRAVVAVGKIRNDGTVFLQGGWANGLSVGSELRLLNEPGDTRLTITAIRGLGRSEARVQTPGRPMPRSIRSGALLEIVTWAAPPDRPLRVWTPRFPGNVHEIAELARTLADEAARRGVHWIIDPIESTPTHLLRRGNREWELLSPDCGVERLGSDPSRAVAAIARIPAGSSLFVQLPTPRAWIDAIAGTGSRNIEAIDRIENPAEADYILVGRYARPGLAYAWVRPSVKLSDVRKVGLPLRTAWLPANDRGNARRETMHELRDAVRRLCRIHAWHLLESPAEQRSPYRLGIRRERDGRWMNDDIAGEEKYALTLRARSTPIPARVQRRYVYAFIIDSHGRSVLLFPRSGSVENRFPLSPAGQKIADAPVEIPLGNTGTFEVTPPYGVDAYFLLTTDEPLPNPWILEWDGVRAGSPQSRTPLEELLILTGSAARSRSRVTPSAWSIERVLLESVPPREIRTFRPERATNLRQ